MSKKRSEARREQRRQQAQREAAARRKQDGADAFVEQMAKSSKKMDDMARQLNHCQPLFVPGQTVRTQNIKKWVDFGQAKDVDIDVFSAAWEPEPPPPPTPTFSECVVGYRQWIVDSVGQLRAVTMTKQVWVPGENVARCRPCDSTYGFFIDESLAEQHDAPHEHCNCGLYGWNDAHRLAHPAAYMDGAGRIFVAGGIAAWGDLRVHATGFRASRACPVALAYDDKTDPRVIWTLKRVADDYRVALVHLDTLQAEVEQHGSPLPEDVRPSTSTNEPAQAIYAPGGFLAPQYGMHYTTVMGSNTWPWRIYGR